MRVARRGRKNDRRRTRRDPNPTDDAPPTLSAHEDPRQGLDRSSCVGFAHDRSDAYDHSRVMCTRWMNTGASGRSFSPFGVCAICDTIEVGAQSPKIE